MSQFIKEFYNSNGQAIHPLCKRYVVILFLSPWLKNFQLLIELLIHSISPPPRQTLVSNFPLQYFFLSLNLLYLALEDGSPIFQQVNTRCTCSGVS